MRGGSFRNDADRLRSANRNRRNPRNDNDNVGFRVVLPVAPNPRPARRETRRRPEQAPAPGWRDPLHPIESPRSSRRARFADVPTVRGGVSMRALK